MQLHFPLSGSIQKSRRRVRQNSCILNNSPVGSMARAILLLVLELMSFGGLRNYIDNIQWNDESQTMKRGGAIPLGLLEEFGW